MSLSAKASDPKRLNELNIPEQSRVWWRSGSTFFAHFHFTRSNPIRRGLSAIFPEPLHPFTDPLAGPLCAHRFAQTRFASNRKAFDTCRRSGRRKNARGVERDERRSTSRRYTAGRHSSRQRLHLQPVLARLRDHPFAPYRVPWDSRAGH
jgi:hypothetical protein